jgi:hypothetical protein
MPNVRLPHFPTVVWVVIIIIVLFVLYHVFVARGKR